MTWTGAQGPWIDTIYSDHLYDYTGWTYVPKRFCPSTPDQCAGCEDYGCEWCGERIMIDADREFCWACEDPIDAEWDRQQEEAFVSMEFAGRAGMSLTPPDPAALAQLQIRFLESLLKRIVIALDADEDFELMTATAVARKVLGFTLADSIIDEETLTANGINVDAELAELQRQVGLDAATALDQHAATVRALEEELAYIATLLITVGVNGGGVVRDGVRELARQHQSLQQAVLERDSRISDMRAHLVKAEADRDEARTIVANVNNSMLGSHGYFTTPDVVEKIEELKALANGRYTRITELEASREAHAEALKAIEAQEKCDKCGRTFPRRLVAIELKDGAPIDDPAGFQWCIVCHGIRVHEQQLARIFNLESQVAALTAKQETIQLVVNSMGDVVNLGRFAQSVDPIRLVNSWRSNLQAALTAAIRTDEY